MFEYRIRVDDQANESFETMTQKALAVLESVIDINRQWLRQNPEMMCILACGKVEYAAECESQLLPYSPVVTGDLILEKRRIMCIDIVGLDVAIRRERNQRAKPHIYPLEERGVFHVITSVEKNGKEIHIDPTSEIQQYGRAVTDQPKCNC